MIKPDYNISSEALNCVVEQYYHPSYENVVQTQSILDKITKGIIMTTRDDGSSEVEFNEFNLWRKGNRDGLTDENVEDAIKILEE